MLPALIPFPTEFRLRLPTIVGNVDYKTLRQRLEQIDALLTDSGLEMHFIQLALQPWLAAAKEPPSPEQQVRFQKQSRQALRCTILKTLLQENYRSFSCQLAGHALYQWFCLIDSLDVIRVPSKSQLQRYSQWLEEKELKGLMQQLLQKAAQTPEKLQLKEALDLEEYFLDTTCVKANLHFPVDWVLLRDGVRTLMKATALIRKQGLKARMESPEEFLKRINRLCLEMTQQKRRAQSGKGRKRVLRQMKKVVKVVQAHARRHRQLLAENWSQTEWTEGQARQVLGRIDRILELLPRAQEQAHERIIGERQVGNQEKILSLYETEARVVVRGKAGAEVEFGNTVLLGENRQGIILDYKMFKDQAPADTQLLLESLVEVWGTFGRKVGAVVADRGFYSGLNSRTLDESETFNGLCPRKAQELRKRMKEEKFVRLQRRRSQTEGRISILKGGYLGKPMRAKGYENRELALGWGVLTHNLWMLARLRKVKDKESVLQAA